MPFVQYLELPPLPDHLISQVYQLIDDFTPPEGIPIEINGSTVILDLDPNTPEDDPNDLGIQVNNIEKVKASLGLPSSKHKTVSTPHIIAVNDAIDQWLRENVCPEMMYAKILVMENGNTFVPHVDKIRKAAYNFVIESGGIAKTSRWKPKLEFEGMKATPYSYVPYERIDLVEAVQIQSRRWHQLDVMEIHSVEELDPKKRRIVLTIFVI